MARVKRYIEANVLDEAKRRLHHIYDLYDTVVVAFSGGKDSLATLHLTREVAQERGIEHVDVVFRDEELIPDPVLDFVNEYRQLPWVRMRWFAVPLESNKFVLGASTRYVQWDPNRPHLRPIPEWAITLDDLGLPPETVVSQYDMDDVTARPYKGRVAIVNGIRATESLIRLRASMNKLNENYLNAGSSRKVTLAKPIFDWVENDVFRYFYDRGIRYCPLYDHQVLSGTELRVSTPLHAETSKRIGRLRTYAPTFYEQVMELFPEMLVQERYYRELDRAAMTAQYAGSIDGIRDWCTENIEDPPQLRKALKTLASITVAHKRNPQAYPLDYLLTQFMTGAFKRRILPISRADQARNARKAAKA